MPYAHAFVHSASTWKPVTRVQCLQLSEDTPPSPSRSSERTASATAAPAVDKMDDAMRAGITASRLFSMDVLNFADQWRNSNVVNNVTKAVRQPHNSVTFQSVENVIAFSVITESVTEIVTVERRLQQTPGTS